MSSGCKPVMGDVLFSKDGAIGKTVVVQADADFVDCVVSDHIIRPDMQRYRFYLFELSLPVPFYKRQVESFVKGGLASNINTNWTEVWSPGPSARSSSSPSLHF